MDRKFIAILFFLGLTITVNSRPLKDYHREIEKLKRDVFEDVDSKDIEKTDFQVKKDEVENDDVERDDVKNDDVKRDEVKNDDVKRDDVKNDDIWKYDIKKDDIQEDDAKKEDVERGEAKKDEVDIDNLEDYNDDAKEDKAFKDFLNKYFRQMMDDFEKYRGKEDEVQKSNFKKENFEKDKVQRDENRIMSREKKNKRPFCFGCNNNTG